MNEKQKKTKKTTQDKQKAYNKERHSLDKQKSPYFLVKTSGRRLATFSQKHGLCPFRVFKVFWVFRCSGCVGVQGVQVFRWVFRGSGVQVFLTFF